MKWIFFIMAFVCIALLNWQGADHEKRIKDLEEIVAHQDQSIDYLLKQDSIANPLNWKK